MASHGGSGAMLTSRSIQLLVVLVAVTATTGTSRAADPPALPINDRVVQYAKKNVGQQVGIGECASLAEAALKSSGAKSWPDFKFAPERGDYVWGRAVYSIEIKEGESVESKEFEKAVRPGDVVQLGGVRFQGKGFTMIFPRHTMVVREVKADRTLAVFEQNVNGKRVVMESEYRLDELKSGWIRIYRPIRR